MQYKVSFERMNKRNADARRYIVAAMHCLESNPKDVQKAVSLIEDATALMGLQKLEIDAMVSLNYPESDEDLTKAQQIVGSYTSNCFQLEKLRSELK